MPGLASSPSQSGHLTAARSKEQGARSKEQGGDSPEDAPRVEVGGVWLERLVVAEDLRGGRGRHGRDEQRVAHAVLRDLRAERGPVPTVSRPHSPQVRLQLAL